MTNLEKPTSFLFCCQGDPSQKTAGAYDEERAKLFHRWKMGLARFVIEKQNCFEPIWLWITTFIFLIYLLRIIFWSLVPWIF